eukprot:TRINITY_DN48515_c0_g1_i1.p1 TRINITY_DN48515_c0_g1~~TRINITY_DN48515_c0_g1_i1.p1  ORF type:complete len:380 (+),score=58.19 TRINITY_DN48515_c0_g1_i1:70-1209(+)
MPHVGARLLLSFAGAAVAQQILPKSINGFMLSGNKEANLDKLNGGALCTDGQGLKPHGWIYTGAINLAKCAEMAAAQPKNVGFKWGRRSFNHDVYREIVKQEVTTGAGNNIDLLRLLGPFEDMICEVYATDVDGGEVDLASNHDIRYGKPEKDEKSNGGNSVCRQRWTLSEFLKPRVETMWFCYLPESNWPACERGLYEFYVRDLAFWSVGLVIGLAALSYTMANQRHFSWALLWCARFLVNMEMGVIAVGVLVRHAGITDAATMYAAALGIIVLSSTILITPAVLLEHYEGCHCWAVLILLLLCFSPCFTFEVMSYYPAFPLLLDYSPLLLGLIGFVVEALKGVLFPGFCIGCTTVAPSQSDGKPQAKEYIPMYYQSS